MYSNEYLGLSDLLDQDLTSYEYYHSLPEALQKEIAKKDFSSFEDMQRYVQQKGRRENPTL